MIGKKLYIFLIIFFSFSCIIQKKEKDYALFYFNNQLIDFKKGINLKSIEKFDLDIEISNKNLPINFFIVRNPFAIGDTALTVIEEFHYNSINEYYEQKNLFSKKVIPLFEKNDFIKIELNTVDLIQNNVFYIYIDK
jgi:hypothetical protein